MQSEMDLAQSIETALEECSEEGTTLLDLVKSVVPELDDESIKTFMSYIVNGKSVRDYNRIVTKADNVKVIPLFAGGVF